MIIRIYSCELQSQKTAGDAAVKKAEQLMKRLNNPQRFGFPVFVVLDETGKVLHIQDSSFLEEGKGYNEERCSDS